MQVEAAKLRLADVVRLGAGEGEREIRKIQKNGAVRVWFRGDESREEPSLEYAPGVIVEIQRPGSLFGAVKPPKTVAEGRERILEYMGALGWTVKRRGFGQVNDYVTDPSDTVRLKLKKQAVALQVRWFDRGAWRWNSNTRSWGPIKKFAANIEDNAAKLVRIAERRAKERFETDQARLGEQGSPSSATSTAEAVDPVVVRYDYAGGVLLGGSTRKHKDVIKALRVPYRFRYSRNLPDDAAWYVPRSRDTHQPRERIEQLAVALRSRGVPVAVEYTEPPTTKSAAKSRGTTKPVSKPRPPAKRQPKSKRARPGRPPNNAKRAAKLRKVADKLEAAATREFQADRLENTPRRARMAAGVRARAARELVLAKTLRRAADEVEAGKLEYVARLANKAQLEALDLELRRAGWERDRAEGRGYDEDREPEAADIDHATYRSVRATPDALRHLLTDAEALPEQTVARRRLEKLAKSGDPVVELDLAEIEALRDLLVLLRRDKDGKLSYSGNDLAEELRRYDRLAKLGIRDTATLRAALREYMSCCRGDLRRRREDPVAAKKQALRFNKIPGYFPTPPELAERAVAEADIRPGMRVLEPSAGDGAIASVIRERRPNAELDVLELNYSLRELLREQGFNVFGSDFLKLKSAPGGVYDRIVMNPPFEKRQDVEHIEHALDLLRPGGRLVAIAASGLDSRADRQSKALHRRLHELGARIEPLPAGSFKSSGTNVNTVLIVADVPARKSKARKRKTESVRTRRKPSAETLQDVWNAHVRRGEDPASSYWKNLPNTSCFVRSEGDVSVTLCPAIQKLAVGDCPPSQAGMKSKGKQLMLCQVDEEVEYFRGQTPGIKEAKAEAENRFLRGRKRIASQPGYAPAVFPRYDDFEGQERILDAYVPTRVVYRREDPFTPIPVKLSPPQITVDGHSQSIIAWKGPIPDDAIIEPWVVARDRMSMNDFADRLGDDLIPYRGDVAPETVRAVLKLVPAKTRRAMAKRGMSMHDVQHGRIAGHSVYWLHDHENRKTYGPVTATGAKVTSAKILREFQGMHDGDVLPLIELPAGMSFDDTILVAALVNGRRVWLAWQVTTGDTYFKAEGEDWDERGKLAARAKWTAKGGYDDFPHRAAQTLLNALEDAPKTVAFRVAGPWLGVLFPSDFRKRVRFDEPTGGELDVDRLREDLATYLELSQAHPDNAPLTRWAKLAPKRLKWAEKWLRAKARAERKAAREQAKAEKTKTEESKMSAKRSSKKKSTKKKSTKKKSTKKKSTKTTSKKKSTTKKPKAKAKAKTASKKKSTTEKAKPKKTASKAKSTTKKTKPKKANSKKKASKKKSTTKKAKSKKTSTAKPGRKKSTTTKSKARKTSKKAPANGKTSKARGSSKPTDKPKRKLRFQRNDKVRFRKRSQIAKGLGVSMSTVLNVEMVDHSNGRPLVVLRYGEGKHRAYIKVPPGHLAVVERAVQVPDEIKACAAKLSRYKGPIKPATRRLMAELAQR